MVSCTGRAFGAGHHVHRCAFATGHPGRSCYCLQCRTYFAPDENARACSGTCPKPSVTVSRRSGHGCAFAPGHPGLCECATCGHVFEGRKGREDMGHKACGKTRAMAPEPNMPSFSHTHVCESGEGHLGRCFCERCKINFEPDPPGFGTPVPAAAERPAKTEITDYIVEICEGCGVSQLVVRVRANYLDTCHSGSKNYPPCGCGGDTFLKRKTVATRRMVVEWKGE